MARKVLSKKSRAKATPPRGRALGKQAIVQFSIGIAVLLAVLLAFQWALGNFPGLNVWLRDIAVQYGYAGLFVFVFIGSTLLPFPTDLVYSSTVILLPNPWLGLLLAIIAGTLAAFLNFALAYFLEEAFVSKFVGKDAIGKVKPFFDEWGAWGILLFGVIPVSPVFDSFTFLAGLAEMDVKRFATFTFISRVLHYGILTFLALKTGGIL